MPYTTLNVLDNERQSVKGLMERTFDNHYDILPGYRCESCGVVNSCNSSKTLTINGDYMMIQLKIFYQD